MKIKRIAAPALYFKPFSSYAEALDALNHLERDVLLSAAHEDCHVEVGGERVEINLLNVFKVHQQMSRSD